MVAQKNKLITTAAKGPQDHRPAKDTIFDIETSEGIIQMRPLRITYGFIEDSADKTEQQIMIEMIDRFIVPESKPVMRELDEVELNQFMDLWQEASGVDLGESSASSD